MRAGLRGEMLAAAEADLEPKRSARVREGRERIARIERAARGRSVRSSSSCDVRSRLPLRRP